MAPLTLGHEAVGTVLETGPGARLDVGTPVAVEGNMHCDECFWCRRGEYQLCARLASFGQMADGGLAEQMVVPAGMCVPFDGSLEPAEVALSEPLSVAVRATRRGAVGRGDIVAVVGGGTIGLLVLQASRLAGAARVVVIEPLGERRRLALALGADAAVEPAESAETVAALTSGRGSDVVIECAGRTAAVRSAIEHARSGGTIVLTGVSAGDVSFPALPFLLQEKRLVASLSHVYDADFVRGVRLIEQRAVAVRPLITKEVPLHDAVGGGLVTLAERAREHLKIIVRLPARMRLNADARRLPVGREPVAGTAYDFTAPRPLAGIALDDSFTNLHRDPGGRATVTLTDRGTGRATSLWLDQAFGWIQVFTGDHLPHRSRCALAVEPMTCPPNAFHTGEDLLVLEPGEDHRGSWGIQVGT